MFVHVMLPLVMLLLPPAPQAVCGADAIAPTAVEEQALAAFDRIFEDSEEMFEAMYALQSGIRDGRPGVQRGNMFTPDVAVIVRARLEQTIVDCGHRVEDILAFINEERLPGAPRPRVNEPFPWALGSSMWPTLLPALPPLPGELQYRFADRDLVLIDMHADLVVDILPNALPAPPPILDATVAIGRR
jgi:hypothetical protein